MHRWRYDTESSRPNGAKQGLCQEELPVPGVVDAGAGGTSSGTSEPTLCTSTRAITAHQSAWM
eukprot:scaffold660918_cov59-Prasinocladus_malaysianus.AAC.1